MKRIFLVAFSATLLAASCQKTEVLNPVGESIGFSTGMSKLTKQSGTADATNGGEVNLQAQDFRVWASYVQDDPNIAGVQTNTFFDGIENLPIFYDEVVAGEWAADKDYYWPGKNKELKFFAVSGGSQINVDVNSPVVIAEDRNSLIINDFQVTPGAYNADLMVADFVRQHQDDKSVDLKFHHALSKVEFLFKTITAENINVFVQKLVVKDLATVADLTVAPTLPEPTENTSNPYAGLQIPVTLTWPTDLTGEVTASQDDDFYDDYETVYDGTDFPAKIEGEDVKDEDKEAMKITATTSETAQVFTTWLMIPQVITGKQVEITYLINERRFTSIFPLSTADLTSWRQNQYIRYNVTIAPNLISFDPDVKDWDQYDADDSTSNKDDIEYQN